MKVFKRYMMVRPIILQSGGSWGTGIPKLHEEEKHVARIQRMYVAFQSYHMSEETPLQAPGPSIAHPFKIFKTAESMAAKVMTLLINSL